MIAGQILKSWEISSSGLVVCWTNPRASVFTALLQHLDRKARFVASAMDGRVGGGRGGGEEREEGPLPQEAHLLQIMRKVRPGQCTPHLDSQVAS